jgi:DNA-binding NarL/FixJ family response regulator
LTQVTGARAEEVTSLAAATSSQEPDVGLAAVAALRSLVEVLESLQVDNARAQGWTWKDIAERLGVSKQAVHKKHAGRRLLRPGR